MKFLKNYKLMTIVLGAIVIVFGIIAAITVPKRVEVSSDEYKVVSAKVTQISERTVGTTKKPKKEYQITVVSEGKEYVLPWSSMPRFSSGQTYDMCLYEGKIYGTVNDMNKAATSDSVSADARVSTIILFISAILFIGYLTAFLRDRKNKKE